MSRLSAFACPNDAPIHSLADIPLRRLPADVGCGTLAPRSQTRYTQHHNLGYTNASTADKLRTCISWRLLSDGAHLHMPIAPSGALLLTGIGCGTLPVAPRPHTATPTACDSNLDSGNHDMSRLSTFVYLDDTPIYALPTCLCACSERVLSVVPCPSLPDQIYTQHHNFG
jgi:hypothetical protein